MNEPQVKQGVSKISTHWTRLHCWLQGQWEQVFWSFQFMLEIPFFSFVKLYVKPFSFGISVTLCIYWCHCRNVYLQHQKWSNIFKVNKKTNWHLVILLKWSATLLRIKHWSGPLALSLLLLSLLFLPSTWVSIISSYL